MGNPKHGPFEGCVYFKGLLWLTGPAEQLFIWLVGASNFKAIIVEKKEANLMYVIHILSKNCFI